MRYTFRLVIDKFKDDETFDEFKMYHKSVSFKYTRHNWKEVEDLIKDTTTELANTYIDEEFYNRQS